MRIQVSALGDSPVEQNICTSSALKKPLNSQTDSEHDKSDSHSQKQSPPEPPDTHYLRANFVKALNSFYDTEKRIRDDNPVDINQLKSLSVKAQADGLDADETNQLKALKLAARRQGQAVGGVIGFFLKFKPYAMLAEVRKNGGLFQPAFGPVVVASSALVTDVLSRHDEFTVDPYGVQMRKSMSPQHNGGYDTFVLSTDNETLYTQDKKLLTCAVNRNDAAMITELIHKECQERLKAAQAKADENTSHCIDVVPTVARFIPVVLIHHYFGVPVAKQWDQFDLDDQMLELYGNSVTGPDGITPLPTSYQSTDGDTVLLPGSALQREDGVIPDEQQMYDWIVACFKHFFNNLQQDISVQAHGVRAYREMLTYILREITIVRKSLQTNAAGAKDNMLTRMLKIQMGIPLAPGEEPIIIDADRVSDLRIAENVMGTIVGAVAGQEEATCRVIDSMIRLNEGDYVQAADAMPPTGLKYGTFEHACELARNINNGCESAQSQSELIGYVFEALRLQPQGEILLRQCVKQGATIGHSRPLRSGDLVFAAHGSAMQDIEQPDAFIVGRPNNNYLHFGYGRHKCLGQYVSPILMVEALVAILQLKNVRRPKPLPDESAFPRERRFGRFQLDDDNLYAKTFSLEYDPNCT